MKAVSLITKEVSDELARLHKIVTAYQGSSNKEMRDWAMDLIDNIHLAYFKSPPMMIEEKDSCKYSERGDI